MRRGALLLTLLALGYGLTACSSTGYVSPNDPQYARSGAPRAGEPVPSPTNLYGRIMGPDGQGGRR
jgi:hypothetical protein